MYFDFFCVLSIFIRQLFFSSLLLSLLILRLIILKWTDVWFLLRPVHFYFRLVPSTFILTNITTVIQSRPTCESFCVLPALMFSVLSSLLSPFTNNSTFCISQWTNMGFLLCSVHSYVVLCPSLLPSVAGSQCLNLFRPTNPARVSLWSRSPCLCLPVGAV